MIKRTLVFGGALLALCVIGWSCTPNTGVEQEVKEITLVAKSEYSKLKTTNNKKPEYACLISTLASDSMDYNYWNRSYWVLFPESVMKEAKGKTKKKLFVYTNKNAGSKAGTYKGVDNVVRVVQCEIPDSERAYNYLDKEFRKFGKKTWLSSKKEVNKKAKQDDDGFWYCAEWFVEWDYTVDSEGNINWYIINETCVRYDYFEEEGPGTGGPGGSPGPGPGGCDPGGTDPCFDDGGGSVDPPPNPNPCEGDNPPVWCACEDTGDPILDNEGIKKEIYNLMVESNANDTDQSERVEQGMWITKDPNTGKYGYAELGEGWSNPTACGIDYDNPSLPPNAVGIVHTHPFSIGEIPYVCREKVISKAQIDAFIQINPSFGNQYEYKGTPSKEDIKLAEILEGLKPGIKLYLVDKDGISEYDKDSKTHDLGNAPRHSQSCYN
ncbi:MAG: hypothetical protein ABJR05_09750 [Balneola sp.]